MSPASSRAAMVSSRAFAMLVAVALALPLSLSLPASTAVLAADVAAPGGRLVVVWKSDAAEARGLRIRVAHIEAVVRGISVVTAATGQSGSLAASLRADPGVASVVPDAAVSVDAWPYDGSMPNDSYYSGYQTDLVHTGMQGAWTITTGSRSTVVAVLDTGFTPHSDFASSAIVHPRNVIAGNATVTDGHGHGTHVSGTIAATTNNGTGVAGIAPNVSLMPVKVLPDTGSGYMSDIVKGVDWARTHGASVINLSLGGYMTAAQAAAFRPAFDAAIQAGVVVVAAAGNNGANDVSTIYPAAFPGVLVVGSTENNDTRSPYSNAGPHNLISAPGSGIVSLDNDGHSYVSMSGTSMATPHVVGAVALLRTIHPDLTTGQVASNLCASSVDLGSPGRDDVFGCGRLDVYAALVLSGPKDRTPIVDSRGPTVRSKSPTAGSTNVSRTTLVQIVFMESVKGVSSNTIWLVNTTTGGKVTTSASYVASSRTATLRTSAPMAGLTRYRAVVGTGITDAAGNRLPARSWVFTTGP